MAPTVAVVSFPGMNCEVESLRAIRRAGMNAVHARWNESREKLAAVDAYFLPGGFSFEDRGRSGMIAARDPLMDFLREEAAKGKAVIGNCNGAQVLVESGLIPLDRGLRMSLAHNVVTETAGPRATGFLSEWTWITPACARDRCATADWEGTMHVPIAHGEGRFTTKDKDVLEELKKSNQIAFRYCDEKGAVSELPPVTPNGSTFAIAGLCNPAGNVVALMPHPERTPTGDPYFASLKRWIEAKKRVTAPAQSTNASFTLPLPARAPGGTEVFIRKTITDNEERTLEQVLRRTLPALRLTQLKYYRPRGEAGELLTRIAVFNPNKEAAYVRRDGVLRAWNPRAKAEEEAAPGSRAAALLTGVALLRRDLPETGGGGETGICYVCAGVSDADLARSDVLEIFANPHASVLERLA